MQLIERIRQTIQKIKIQHIDNIHSLPVNKNDYISVEKAITLNLGNNAQFTLMCTPNNIKKLAVGFLYTQGIIKNIEDIEKFSQHKNIVNVVLKSPQIYDHNFIKSSSGGTFNTIFEKLILPPTLFIDYQILFVVMQEIQRQQKLFKITGGTHAAAIFLSGGKIIACCEDIGRHNALDKVIGECLLTKKNFTGCGVALSGRVSLEMVNKAAKAGIEIIASVSAPSSLAIQMAEKYNITLCGFVRNEKANIYSHPIRLIFKPK